MEPSEPPAISAIAAGSSVGLLLVPSFDMRRPPLGALSSRPLLAQPAPLPRPMVVRSDNVGVRQAAAAVHLAFEAVNDGLAVGRQGPRTHCWVRGTAAATPAAKCPLRRKADCHEWREGAEGFNEGARAAAPSKEPESQAVHRTRCLPSALLLGARGCGTPAFGRRLAEHPDVVSTPSTLLPWWSYRALANFTEGVGVRTAVAELLAKQASPGLRGEGPQRAEHAALAGDGVGPLLLQRSVLDARAAGLGRVLRRAGVGLGDVLPRVQPRLKVILYVCSPVARLRALNRSAEAAASLIKSVEVCLAHAPLSQCVARLAAAAPLVDGLYSVGLRSLLRALPAAQVRVLRAEDFAREPGRATREAWRFLELSEVTPDGQKEDASDGKPEKPPRPSAHDEAVEAFYREQSAELVQLMDGDERFAWASEW